MPELLTVHKAASLVGLTRSELQKKIRKGEIVTFEGMLSLDELKRVFPDAQLDDNTEIERVANIKKHAFARRVREHVLPDKDVLGMRINELGQELAEANARLSQYKNTLNRLQTKLSELERSADTHVRNSGHALQLWLKTQLDEITTQPPEARVTAEDSFIRVIAAKVHMLPGQQEFFVPGSDSILESGLRAGVALDYGCSDGSCGLCKARIVSGEIKQTMDYSYPLSDEDKKNGYALLCANTAINDLEIHGTVANNTKDIPLQRITTQVKSMERPRDDVIILHLKTPPDKRLRFLSGQSVILELGSGLSTELPVASCPCEEQSLQFHVLRSQGTPFTEYVFSKLGDNDQIALEGPIGGFVLREHSPPSLVFITFDSSFATTKSLMEHAMALDITDSLHLFWIADPQHPPYLQNLCRAWTDALDNFHFSVLDMTNTPQEIAQQIVEDIPDMNKFDVYLAGPEALAEPVGKNLLESGLSRSRLSTKYT